MSIWKSFKKMSSWRLLPPRDKEFYNLFNEISHTLVEASGLLIELFNSDLPERAPIEVKIGTCVTRCNQIAESLANLLRMSQQPPFDRSDISLFSDHTLQVMKYIKHAANRYMIYDFPSSDKEMRELGPLFHEACQQIERAVQQLSKSRDIGPFCRAIDKIESKADNIYHDGLHRRFKEIRRDRASLEEKILEANGKDAVSILLPIISDNVEYTRHVAIFFILRQVYAEMERGIDACTDVAAALSRMVSENV
jgi:uncharacterized protein Yka (UPF0111/DUF47 family)